MKKTKEKLSLLSTKIVEWAKSQGLKRVTKVKFRFIYWKTKLHSVGQKEERDILFSLL